MSRRWIRWLLAAGLVVTMGAGPAAAIDGGSTPDHLPKDPECPPPIAVPPPFVDVAKDHPYRAAIECLVGHGLAQGYGDRTFKPDRGINRRHMALILSHAIRRVSDVVTVMGFPHPSDYDQEPPQVQAAIAMVLTYGVMDLAPDGAFGGDEPVTRIDMARMMINLLLTSTQSGLSRTPDGGLRFESAPHYPDDQFDDTMSEAASFAYELGITSGYGDGTFRPDIPVTRGQMAVFISRTLAHVPNQPGFIPRPSNRAP